MTYFKNFGRVIQSEEMAAQVFLQGCQSSDGRSLLCSLPSSCALFFLRYCQSQKITVNFVTSPVSEGDDANCCDLPMSAVEGFSRAFLPWKDVPDLVKNTSLPSLYEPEMSLVRAGLCVVLRTIIKIAHKEDPAKSLIDLLGFRQGSMRMCAEVSGWTKLCEVELPLSLSQLIQVLRNLETDKACSGSLKGAPLTLPIDLIKLEEHFGKKCKVHNDDKKRRAELVRLKSMVLSVLEEEKAHSTHAALIKTKAETSEDELNTHVIPSLGCLDLSRSSTNHATGARIDRLRLSESVFYVEHTVVLPHGVRRVRTTKTLDKVKHLEHSEEVQGEVGVNRERRLKDVVEQLSYMDVEFVHTYSEGPEITLADLILFVYIYLLLKHTHFACHDLSVHLPRILAWMEHMTSLPVVSAAAQQFGWDLKRLQKCLASRHGAGSEGAGLTFRVSHDPSDDQDDDEMELSRCVRMKHKAIKPEVLKAFKKLEVAEIQPILGYHPKGGNVTVDWEGLPDGVHPREGDVPEKRTRRKCQQLENLATAVESLARPGDAIVDFCSGGGHLGIVLAYLLPDCHVYLVENKEESLLKVCSRLKQLALRNVTLYQCNIDYFIGKFEVGVCLHACGSATDMVLQLCLDTRASFVICPCCYGSIHKTHLLDYPRSKQFQNSSITYKDFLTLGHAADQTEFNIALEGQGREAMNLVDTDRAAYARELGYTVSLCSLKPLTCTPKNNLLVGAPIS